MFQFLPQGCTGYMAVVWHCKYCRLAYDKFVSEEYSQKKTRSSVAVVLHGK